MAKSYFKKTKKAPHKYKSQKTYLKALFMANREMIEKKYIEYDWGGAISKPKTAYQMFKEEIVGDDTINSISIQDVKMRAAELSTTQWYGRHEQLKEDIRGMFKKDSKALRELRHQLGWKTKIDWNNVKYHGDPMDKDNRYFYIENEKGERVGFKLGDYYKNKKRLTLVYLDENNDVVYEAFPE